MSNMHDKMKPNRYTKEALYETHSPLDSNDSIRRHVNINAILESEGFSLKHYYDLL